MQELHPNIHRALERLSGHGFDLLPIPEVSTHYVVTRDGLVALIERREDGQFGSSGNPGKLTDRGIAQFVRKQDRCLFVAKGNVVEATEKEAGDASRFARDLKAALAL